MAATLPSSSPSPPLWGYPELCVAVSAACASPGAWSSGSDAQQLARALMSGCFLFDQLPFVDLSTSRAAFTADVDVADATPPTSHADLTAARRLCIQQLEGNARQQAMKAQLGIDQLSSSITRPNFTLPQLTPLQAQLTAWQTDLPPPSTQHEEGAQSALFAAAQAAVDPAVLSLPVPSSLHSDELLPDLFSLRRPTSPLPHMTIPHLPPPPLPVLPIAVADADPAGIVQRPPPLCASLPVDARASTRLVSFPSSAGGFQGVEEKLRAAVERLQAVGAMAAASNVDWAGDEEAEWNVAPVDRAALENRGRTHSRLASQLPIKARDDPLMALL